MSENKRAIVIDTGSGYCKSGFASDDSPRSVFRTKVGDSINGKEPLVGDEAVNETNILSPKEPITKLGIPNNFSDLETLWSAVFNYELRVNSREHDILLCESLATDNSIRERCAEIFFDTFEIQNYFSTMQFSGF